MDTDRFDAITRLFAGRRQAPPPQIGIGQDATPTAGTNDLHTGADSRPDPEFLFVQTFVGGTWAPKQEEGTYALTLSGAAANTVFFSDRPERIVGLTPTQDLLDTLGFTPTNPPNAALVAQTDTGEQDILVIELLNPAWDGNGTLTYDARVLADYGDPGLAHLSRQQAGHSLPETFAAGSLFIDDCPDITMHCLEIDVTPNVMAGDTVVHQCYDATYGTCLMCQDPGTICMDVFPDQCMKEGYDYVNQTWVKEQSCTGRFD
jgi:hypothetical protein